MIDVEKANETEVAAMAEAKKTNTKNPYLKQMQAQAPQLFPERDDSEVCGNCLEFKVSGGKGKCMLRYLPVDAVERACEFFAMREMDEDDEDGEDADEEDDD